MLGQLRTLGVREIIVEVGHLHKRRVTEYICSAAYILCQINTLANCPIIILNNNQLSLTSLRTSSNLSTFLLRMCLRTKSGPLNFLPDSGHSHLSLPSSCVLAWMNFSTSVNAGSKGPHSECNVLHNSIN